MKKKHKLFLLSAIFVTIGFLNLTMVFNNSNLSSIEFGDIEAIADSESGDPFWGYELSTELCFDNITYGSVCNPSDCYHACQSTSPCPEPTTCEIYGHLIYQTFCYEYCSRPSCIYSASIPC